MKDKLELTILMPCLNEVETIAKCIIKAKSFLKTYNIDGEVLVADNGSTDGSVEIAEENGARVVKVPIPGYGSALIGGTKAAIGKYVIIGDADDSYDFTNLIPFINKLREGYELVMGNRFRGGIEPGAMPPLHKYLGNPVLTGIGRLFYKSNIGDFHCGLRGYNRESLLKLDLQSLGMEYASEMVVKSTLKGLRMTEVPTKLSKDGRSHRSHLRSWRDGWRHLKFLMVYSPNWMFLYPGIFLTISGLISMAILLTGEVRIGYITFDITTLMYAAMTVIVGVEFMFFAIFTKVLGIKSELLYKNDKIEKILGKFSLEKGIFTGLVLSFIGVGTTIYSITIWAAHSFSDLNASQIMRIAIPASTLIIVGIQFICSSFYIYFIDTHNK